MIGVMNEFGMGHEKDMSLAIKSYTIASNQNNADAMNHLGRLYETGKGCEISTKTAYALYKKALQRSFLHVFRSLDRSDCVFLFWILSSSGVCEY